MDIFPRGLLIYYQNDTFPRLCQMNYFLRSRSRAISRS